MFIRIFVVNAVSCIAIIIGCIIIAGLATVSLSRAALHLEVLHSNARGGGRTGQLK